MIEQSEKLRNLFNDVLDKCAEIVVKVSFGNLGEDLVDQFSPATVLVIVNHIIKIMQEVSWIGSLTSFSTSELLFSIVS